MKKVKIMQGDVIASTIESLPEGATEVKNTPIALGEVHGHAHIVTGDVKRYDAKGRILFLVMQMGAMLQHVKIDEMQPGDWNSVEQLPVADHGPVRLSPGIYEFYIQNEYNPYRKLMEKVKD